MSFICDSNKDKESVIKSVENAKCELSEYKEFLLEKLDSDIWNVYGERFDSPASVKQKSFKIIEKILNKFNPEGCMYYNQTYYQLIYDKLVIFSKEVISAHNTKSKKNSCKLKFSMLLEIVVRDHKSDSNTTHDNILTLKVNEIPKQRHGSVFRS